MKYRERGLGTPVVFLLPSLKLKNPSLDGPSVESRLHSFLMDNFGGYTAQAGNIFGYWREQNGRDSYGEHREFSVASMEASQLPMLKEFLARMAQELREECIYFRTGETASLIYPAERARAPGCSLAAATGLLVRRLPKGDLLRVAASPQNKDEPVQHSPAIRLLFCHAVALLERPR